MRSLIDTPDGRTDTALALVVLGLSVLTYANALTLPPPFFDPLGSAAVPKFVSVVLAILSFALLYQRWRNPGRQPGPLGYKPTPGIALACIVTTIAYVGVMAAGWLGFREASIIFIIVLGGTLAQWRRSALLFLAPAAVVIGIGFHYLFTDLLYIDLPKIEWSSSSTDNDPPAAPADKAGDEGAGS